MKQPKCDCCGKPGMFIHSRCHTGVPMWATLMEGDLVLTCSACDGFVGRFPLAESTAESTAVQPKSGQKRSRWVTNGHDELSKGRLPN
jgi:hypothetical protein